MESEKRKAHRKQYHEDNAETIKEYQKQYYKDNREKILKRQKENAKEYRKNNSEKIKKYNVEYDKKNSLKRKGSHIKRNYGITLEEHNLMFNKQEGKCKICGRHQNEIKIPFAVDHDHTTGRIRGLLCHKCNQGLGYFNDNIDLLMKAINHLKNNHQIL